MPVIRGTNLRVQTLVIALHDWKETTAELAQQYDLPERIVREAIGFYQAHQPMVDALIQADVKLEGALD